MSFHHDFANNVARSLGEPKVFWSAVALVIIWAISGPFFHFSEIWQIEINTATSIITFLMIFLLQNAQNRDSAAIQAKLDELIRVTKDAHNDLIGIEKETVDKIE